MPHKVLVITYYWPPSGGSGVQRWVKFTKYMRNFGWEPVIYTPANPERPVRDESLSEELPENLTVLKTNIFEPYDIYKKLTGRKQVGTGFMKEEGRPSPLEGLFRWIRGNFFIPDARKFWIKPSIQYLTRYLHSNPVDAIVSTGPPHSMHLIARGLKKAFQYPWLADFRDPWTNIDFYDELRLTRWADKKHHRLEADVLINADAVTVVSPTMQRDMQHISGRRIHLLTNGFDPADFPADKAPLFKKFNIAHIGSMVETRNPRILWQVLTELLKEEPDFKKHLRIDLIGKIDHSIIHTLENFGLTSFVHKPGYLSHDEVVRYQQRCHILLLVLNNTPNAACLLPGKLFEYLAAERPVLTIGPANSDASEIMELSDHYCMATPEKKELLKAFIRQQFSYFKNDTSIKIDAKIDWFSRLTLTQRLTDILNNLSA